MVDHQTNSQTKALLCAHLAARTEKSALCDTIQSTAIMPLLPPPLVASWPPLLPLSLVPPGVMRVQIITPSAVGSKLPTPCRNAAGGNSGGRRWQEAAAAACDPVHSWRGEAMHTGCGTRQWTFRLRRRTWAARVATALGAHIRSPWAPLNCCRQCKPAARATEGRNKWLADLRRPTPGQLHTPATAPCSAEELEVYSRECQEPGLCTSGAV